MDEVPNLPLVRALVARSEDTSSRLHSIHQVILSRYPFVHRIALALYDPATDVLKTFANSQAGGVPLSHYEARLSDVPSLRVLADNRELRVIDDIDDSLHSHSRHTDWLRSQAFRSSYTLPIYSGNELAAFLFFDSREPGRFDDAVTRFLEMFADLAAQLFLFKLSAVRSLVGAVQIANRIASLRDVETGEHLQRMAKYSRLIARRLIDMDEPIDDEFVEYVHLFAPLHDIGKVGVPDRILLKPGKLDAEEWAQMKSHVDIGVAMVEHIIEDIGFGSDSAAQLMRNIVGGHHERGDGSGYPRGLKGDAIPLEARIVATADVFDALSTARPYKPAWSEQEVIAEMRKEAARGRLCARCVEALLDDREALREIQQQFRDQAPAT